MLVPGTRHKADVQAGALPFAFGLGAVIATVLGWAIFAARPTGDELDSLPFGLVDPAALRNVAYFLPESGTDTLYVRSLDGGGPVAIASFPSLFNIRARGSASPSGERIAVLSIRGPASALGRLTIVDLPQGGLREAEANFDYLTPFAWSPDSRSIVMTRTTLPDASGRVDVSLIETNVETADSVHLTLFAGVLQAVPVGFSMDGQRLFVVVIDQTGSSLWEEREGRTRRVGSLSLGRTQDWSLSPDGSRLAYVDVRNEGDLAYVGRTMTIATGRVSESLAAGDQHGSAWRPRTDFPSFGGPGGSLRLTDPVDASSYVVPNAWSPDGTTLAATIINSGTGDASRPEGSVELVTDTHRVRLSERAGAQFIGYVRSAR